MMWPVDLRTSLWPQARLAFDRSVADLLCHRSFFSCKDNTLNVVLINNNNKDLLSIPPSVVVSRMLSSDVLSNLCSWMCVFLKKNQSTPRSSEHPPVRGEKNVKTFRWDQRLQIQNLFMASKRVVVVVVVFTLKAVPVSTQYFLASVLVQLTRTPSVVTG